MKTLPPTSLAARPGNWDPADHRGFWLGRFQYGSSGWTTFTLGERSLLRASRVCTPGLVSTATLPSVIRGGYNDNDNNDNNNTGPQTRNPGPKPGTRNPGPKPGTRDPGPGTRDQDP